MAYDNNDEPIYSMLTTKTLSGPPCSNRTYNTGSCSGFCKISTDVNDAMNYSATLEHKLTYAKSMCDDEISRPFHVYYQGNQLTFNNGTCLGVWSEPNPYSPGEYSVSYATCWV
jgi:hypothetical protein